MTPAESLLAQVSLGTKIPGRHLIVAAHPDDEAISCATVLAHAESASVCFLSTGAVHEAEVQLRLNEREDSWHAAGWTCAAMDGQCLSMEVYRYLGDWLALLHLKIADYDAVWTHPYEGGHPDHDSAAWLVQTVCAGLPILRMEFASYHSRGDRRDVFGEFWPAAGVEINAVLTGDLFARKQAALAAYQSQLHILRKYPRWDHEPYREAPVYRFDKPAPPPACRWDRKGYQPPSAEWRALLARMAS